MCMPRHSMYAIYAYIGVVWGVNVGIWQSPLVASGMNHGVPTSLPHPPDAPPRTLRARTLRSFAQGLALLDEAMASPRTKPFAPVTDELRARSGSVRWIPQRSAQHHRCKRCVRPAVDITRSQFGSLCLNGFCWKERIPPPAGSCRVGSYRVGSSMQRTIVVPL